MTELLTSPASVTPPAVRFDDVQMIFPNGLRRPVWALRGLTMEIGAGAVVGLLGPNGCGKTTAISCLLGLLRPQGGQVQLFGERVDGALPLAAPRGPGVLLEDTRLPPFLSVRASLATVGRVRGLRGVRLKREIARVIELAGLAGLLDRRIAVLSKGQARRVGLGAALVADPQLLLLDEPSAGLDVAAREEFNDLVRRLRDGHRTILIASHLLSDVESTCTHVAIMREGRVVVHQDSETLLREARDLNDQRDMHVDRRHAARLAELGIPTNPSKYPGQLQLASDEEDHAVLLKLAQNRIVPSRIEPRVSLVSLYLDLTRSEKE